MNFFLILLSIIAVLYSCKQKPEKVLVEYPWGSTEWLPLKWRIQCKKGDQLIIQNVTGNDEVYSLYVGQTMPEPRWMFKIAKVMETK